MTDPKLTAYLKPVEDLPPQDVLRISGEVIVHMEETRPEVWYLFLYEQGMHCYLGRHLASSPFTHSPIHLAMEREIAKLHPQLDHWKASQVRRAIQAQAGDLISKYFKFTPPPPRRR